MMYALRGNNLTCPLKLDGGKYKTGKTLDET
jgi:hypothetical protein